MTEANLRIQQIGQKVQQLVKKYERLQREHEYLKLENQAQLEQIETLETTVTSLEDQLAILKSATTQMDEGERKDFEKRINHFVRDIDKVIGHLLK